jgi:hypothetical protein
MQFYEHKQSHWIMKNFFITKTTIKMMLNIFQNRNLCSTWIMLWICSLWCFICTNISSFHPHTSRNSQHTYVRVSWRKVLMCFRININSSLNEEKRMKTYEMRKIHAAKWHSVTIVKMWENLALLSMIYPNSDSDMNRESKQDDDDHWSLFVGESVMNIRRDDCEMWIIYGSHHTHGSPLQITNKYFIRFQFFRWNFMLSHESFEWQLPHHHQK